MTSREIIRRAIERERPARLPVIFDDFGVTDMVGIGVDLNPSTLREGLEFDEWNCGWEKHPVVKNIGQVKVHPLKDLRDIDRIVHPDWNADRHWKKTPQALADAERNGKYVTGALTHLIFERMQDLIGMEAVLENLLLDTPAMEALADRILAVQFTYLENLARRTGRRVHAIGMTDDWGTQAASIISMDLWYKVFAPRYQRFFSRMHELGYHVWLHSCGKINDVIQGFIDVGVDVVNLQQVNTLGIQEIGRRYQGKIAFWTLADIQNTLPKNDPALVDRDVDAIMTHWADPQGGVIFTDYGDDVSIGVGTKEIKRHMYRRFSDWSERMYGAPLPDMVQ